MTAKTTREYMTKMKLRYARAKHRSERSALIDEAVTMTGFSRKYVIRLLCGSRIYKKRHGRAPTYSNEARDRLVKIWFAFGQMCSRYLHSIIEKAIADYQEARPNVYFSPKVIRELLQMSPSTMARILRPHQFQMRSAKRRVTSKGISYKRKIDDPLTPYQRLAQIIPLPPPPKYNAVKIRSQCERMLNRLFSTQHSARSMGKGRHAVPSP